MNAARCLLLVGLASGCRPAPAPAPAPLVATPESLGFDPAHLDSIVAYLRTRVDSAFPGAVVAVGRHGRIALLAGVGHYGADDPRPVTAGTIYDLASVTKVVGLTTAALLLVDAGRLDLNAPVTRYVPAFRGPGKERVTIRHLLTHSSGLPAWRPLFRETGSRAAAFALADTTPLERQPGDTFVYSDLGAIVLTQVVERVTGERLDRYLAARVFGPLAMRETRYRPPSSWRDRIAPTENDTVFRHRVLRGEVHDENAGRMDGVSGHAGLFSTATDLARFATWMLERRNGAPVGSAGSCAPTIGASGRPSNVAASAMSVRCTPGFPAPSPDLVRAFTRRQGVPPGSTRALGWDTPSDSGYSSAGRLLSRTSFGHTGFTGTSIWIDPDRDLFVILLSNRVNPTRANTRILDVRPRVADLVAAALANPDR